MQHNYTIFHMIKEQKIPMSKGGMKLELRENQNETLTCTLHRKVFFNWKKRKDIGRPLCSTTPSKNTRFIKKKKKVHDSSEQNTIVWLP